jgi:hypothetical protein
MKKDWRQDLSMTSARKMSIALSVISYLFLIMGIVAVIEMVITASRGGIHPDFCVLGLGIFVGLRRFSRSWRTCALVFTWFGLIGLAAMIGFILYDGGMVFRRPSDLKFVDLPLIWSLMIVMPFFMLQVWQYRVLTRPDVRSLFYGESQTPTT